MTGRADVAKTGGDQTSGRWPSEGGYVTDQSYAGTSSGGSGHGEREGGLAPRRCEGGAADGSVRQALCRPTSGPVAGALRDKLPRQQQGVAMLNGSTPEQAGAASGVADSLSVDHVTTARGDRGSSGARPGDPPSACAAAEPGGRRGSRLCARWEFEKHRTKHSSRATSGVVEHAAAEPKRNEVASALRTACAIDAAASDADSREPFPPPPAPAHSGPHASVSMMVTRGFPSWGRGRLAVPVGAGRGPAVHSGRQA